MQVSTASVASPADRAELWDEYVQQTCGTLQVLADRGSFGGGSIVTRSLGTSRISVIAADAHSVIRQDRVASNEGGDMYIVRPLRGTVRLSQGDSDVTIHTGELVSFDSSRPYTLTMPEPFEMVAVRTSHQALGLTYRNAQRLTARPWRGNTGVVALASGTLAALATHIGELDEVAPDLLGTTVGGLVSALFAEQLRTSTNESVGTRQLLMLRIRCFIANSLGDATLSPAMVARAHNISLRYLQILFAEQDTSPARWIRDERLNRIRADLGDPRYDHLSVAAIGERWGLTGASQISRHFRLRFGITPSAFRRMRIYDAQRQPTILTPDRAARDWW